MEITTYKPAYNFITEHSKKKYVLAHDNFPKKSDDNYPKVVLNNTSLKPNDPNENDIEKVIRVPVRLVGGAEDELFFLQIPEKTLNRSKISAILKIEILNASNYNTNDVSKLPNLNEFEIINGSMTLDTTVSNEEVTTTESEFENYPTNFPNFVEKETSEKTLSENKNEKFVPFKINGRLPDYIIESENMQNLTRNIQNVDKGLIESAIYHVQNSLQSNNNKRPFLNRGSKNENPTSNKDSPDIKKVQRVLIYRGSAKHRSANETSPRRWVTKKVGRKVTRREKSTPPSNFERSVSTTPEAVKVDDFTEVSLF